MTCVCLWIPSWSTAAACKGEALPRLAHSPQQPTSDRLTAALLRVAPRVAIGASGLLWADARGLPGRELAEALCTVVGEHGGSDVSAGVARTAIAAEVAARQPALRTDPSSGHPVVTLVSPGQDRAFLASHPLSVVHAATGGADIDPSLLPLLADLGIGTCEDLARLGREEVEVRCGGDGIRLWRLARAEDRRRPFGALPRALPRASCTWTDYALRDGERLLFVIHGLLAQVCDMLRTRGLGARALALQFALADRTVVDHTLRTAHPTADRATWLRLIRADLETIRFSDAVTGITVQVGAAAPPPDGQGDIFDRGFATARATAQAVEQLLDVCGTDATTFAATAHPLLERRAQWQVRESLTWDSWSSTQERTEVRTPSLTVQLLPSPRSVRVATAARRDHEIPVRYLDGDLAVEILVATGPDRVNGGGWEATPFARDYFHCVTTDGRLVLLFRTADRWFLHGWWD